MYYRGTTSLSKEEVISIYGGSYIPQEMIRGSSTEVITKIFCCIIIRQYKFHYDV